jgi:tetratricopeptide (TPR) repeat protein
MRLIRLWFSAALVLLATQTCHCQRDVDPLAQQQWIETRTAHFNIYSPGNSPEVGRLAARLEQFCQAYSALVGSQAVASPPIVVMAFPDHQSMRPFLPLYQGRPANLAGFFNRGSDENLIVLSLPPKNSSSLGLEVIFHEYAHLLFRHNDRIWPLWLKEGMAEVYSTFETTGRNFLIAQPIERHLDTLAHQPLMPLHELFSVAHDSPQYNERSRQGMFYAESWLLTDYLMAAYNGAYKARFGQFTVLLRQGQFPEQAFTNALGASLPAIEAGMRQYLAKDKFSPIELPLASDVSARVYEHTRVLTPVETLFRLGDELMRVGRLDDAESYFDQAKKIAPASPLPFEGLGLLAEQRGQHDVALRNLKEAMQRGSTSFLAYYVRAKEEYLLTADGQNRYAPLKGDDATQIRNQLHQSLALMYNFAPAHELLGFFEMAQGQNLATAKQHLQIAIQLEPENPSYLLTLAQAQLTDRDEPAARRTLEPLLLPNVNAKLRASAEEVLREINGH